MQLVVQKYGGTSVGTLDHIRNVARHIDETVRRGSRVIVTISAMGEQTDELLAMALALSSRPPRRELDMLLTAGERISAALLAIALDARAVRSVSLTGSQCGILTDETHGNARITRILGDRIREGLADGKVVIVAGFQGVSPRTKEITTLGRGGTDLSAIAIAGALKADVCQLYKDVRGIYTCDPRLVGSARLLPRVGWGTMTELAWGGASVLHPRGAHLAAKFAIPFEVRSSLELDQGGTIIAEDVEVESPRTHAIAHKSAQSLVVTRVTGRRCPALVAEALDWLWRQGESPAFSTQLIDDGGQTQLTQVIKTGLVDDYLARLREAAERAGEGLELVRRQDKLATISIVGQGFRQSPETIQQVCEALASPALLMETTNTVISLCVREDQVLGALGALHRTLLESGD